MIDQSYPPEVRLRKKEEYDHVLARKCSIRGKFLMVYGCENEVGHARLGRIVSKRWGNAIARNRFRRWLREAFRRNKTALPAIDFVVMIVQQIGINYAAVEAELKSLPAEVEQKLKRKR